MSLISRIRNAFTREAPRTLRNRAGGMAWIVGLSSAVGEEAMNRRAVRCIRHDGQFWKIDPPQRWVATGLARCYSTGQLIRPGDYVVTDGLPDEKLQPWRDDGVTDKEVADLYAPNRTKEPV